MDSHCSNGIKSAVFDEEFKDLLEVDGNFLKRLFFRNVVALAKSFYDSYVSWCERNGKYIDFIEPLYYHLFCSGIRLWKINMYMRSIHGKILRYIKMQTSSNG